MSTGNAAISPKKNDSAGVSQLATKNAPMIATRRPHDRAEEESFRCAYASSNANPAPAPSHHRGACHCFEFAPVTVRATMNIGPAITAAVSSKNTHFPRRSRRVMSHPRPHGLAPRSG